MGLPQIARDRLISIGDISSEEREMIHELESIDALLAVYFKGMLDGQVLFTILKQAEECGKQYVIKSARDRLEGSFMEGKLPFKFNENSQGILSIQMINKENSMEEKNSPVIVLNGQNFDAAVRDNPSLVVDCWAPWCGPCRMMSPVIDELAAENNGKITFAKLNTDENQEIAMKYQIQAIPTLLIFKDGKLIDRKIGALPKKLLQAELDKSLK